MVMDQENRREDELNQERKEARDPDDEGGIVDTVDRVFDSVINPKATTDQLDEDEERQRRLLNDEAARDN